MYEREGFTYDRPKGQGNCVMVREVAPIGPCRIQGAEPAAVSRTRL
jgi:hypothetical protein